MSDVQSADCKPCALLWDESYLWGLMAWKALRQSDLPFDLVRSEEIRAGALSSYAMIFVPGGWAAAKVSALGKAGLTEIRRFVQDGGSYLGICGGAGLATDSHLGLLPVYRTPNLDRVPSFSGPIRLTLSDHPIWNNVPTPVFHAWWPPQLDATIEKDFRILARYDEALPQAMSADILVADGRKTGWAKLEKAYGILLDPDRLKGEPAVVEGLYGRGKVVLSLVHFDTPNDPNSARVLKNLWRYLIDEAHCILRINPPFSADVPCGTNIFPFADILDDIARTVSHLIAEGERRHFWRRRNELLLQWRRGIRGMEYSTLCAMTQDIAQRLSVHNESFKSPAWPDQAHLKQSLEQIGKRLHEFADESIPLLRLEHAFVTGADATREPCRDEKINRLREVLFGASRQFGGKFKILIDALDYLLYRLLKSDSL